MESFNQYQIIDIHNLEENQKNHYTQKVHDYLTSVGHEKYQMLALTPEELNQRFGKALMFLADAEAEPELVAYVSATQPYEHNDKLMSETGTLYTLDEHQGKGHATNLMQDMTDYLYTQGITPYMFANDNSLHIGQKIGYQESAATEVPVEALEACSGCIKKQLGAIATDACCDTILVHNQEKSNEK